MFVKWSVVHGFLSKILIRVIKFCPVTKSNAINIYKLSAVATRPLLYCGPWGSTSAHDTVRDPQRTSAPHIHGRNIA